jgi:hypothetical protein
MMARRMAISTTAMMVCANDHPVPTDRITGVICDGERSTAETSGSPDPEPVDDPAGVVEPCPATVLVVPVPDPATAPDPPACPPTVAVPVDLTPEDALDPLPEDPVEDGPGLVAPTVAAVPVTFVGAVAPPVPVVHCVEPCLSQAAGYGAVLASRFVPLGENVGLLQLAMLMFCTLAPGIFAICVKLACTRLIGIGE